MFRKYDPSTIKKILLVRPDAIGDMVLATPAFQALREQFPSAHLTVLASPYNAPVIENHSVIDEILIDKIVTGEARTWRELWRYVGELREKHFDLVMHFYSEWPLVPITWLAGIPFRIGDKSKIPLRFFYNITKYIRDPDQTRHVVEYSLQFVKAVSYPTSTGWWHPENKCVPTNSLPLKPTSLLVNDQAKECVLKRLNHLGVDSLDKLVGVHISVGGDHPIWPPKHYAQVVDHLIQKRQATVILTGTKRDKPLRNQLLAICRNHPIDLIGETSIPELIALISLYQLYIGMDTGPFHIATAFQIPMVAIFPNKIVKPTRWGPWLSPHRIVRQVHIDKEKGLTTTAPVQDTIKSVDLLLGKNNSSTAEEHFYDWFSKSTSVLIVMDQQKDMNKTEQLILLLTHANIPVTFFSPFQDANHYVQQHFQIPSGLFPLKGFYSLKQLQMLLNWIVHYDITIIHHLGQTKRRLFLAAAQLSALKINLPPLPLFQAPTQFATSTDLIRYYRAAFQQC